MKNKDLPPPRIEDKAASSVPSDYPWLIGNPPLTRDDWVAPPEGWPTEGELLTYYKYGGRMSPPKSYLRAKGRMTANKIKSTLRGGLGAGRGDVPHTMNQPSDYGDPFADSDPTPPKGIRRPKL